MLNKKSLALTVTLCVLSSASIQAAEPNHGKAIDYRASLMGVFKWNMGNMGNMMKGKVPFEKAAFAGYADNLATASQLDLLSGFPEGSDESDDTDARAEIWMDWDNFAQKYQDFQTAAEQLAKTAKSGDQQAIGPQMGAVGKSCKACHKAFKD